MGAALRSELSLLSTRPAGDELSWRFAQQLTGDRTEMMRKVRAHYLECAPPLERLDVVDVLLITRTVEEIFVVFPEIESEFNLRVDARDSIERSA